MKLHKAFFIFLIGFNGFVMTNQPSTAGINSIQQQSILSIFLFFPLVDGGVYSSPMAKSQLEVTPDTTITVNNILVTSQFSGSNNCNDAFNTYIIGATDDPTFTLTGGHTYSTTDASMQALTTAGGADYVGFETLMQFRNGTTNVGNAVCIPAGGTCVNSTDCGWNSTRSWAP